MSLMDLDGVDADAPMFDPAVFGSHPANHGVEVTFELLGAVEPRQPESQPEQKAAEERDDGERLLFDQLRVKGSIYGLYLCHRGFADRHELVHQVLEDCA